MLRDSRDGATTIAVFVFSLLVYALTLAPSLGPVDAGELAAAAYTLGVAHPTGYPLYALLGRAFIVACRTARASSGS
jgi:hypothetical protein